MIVLESLLLNVLLVLFNWLVLLESLLDEIGGIVGLSDDSGYLGLVVIHGTGQMVWLVARFVSSDFDFSSLVIDSKLRDVLS